MKKTIKIFSIIILLFFIAIAILMGSAIYRQNKQINNMEFSKVDMFSVADGTYEGISETQWVKVTVEVAVEDHKITNIKIVRHENGKGAKAEEIINAMIAKNTYDVDAVSGATVSSIVIKNAVNKALINGLE